MAVLTDDEMISLGMNPIAGQDFEEDEEETFLPGGVPGERVQYDNEGRPVITFEQVLELRKRGVQVSSYALRVYRPKLGPSKVWLIPANLYHKWYGLQYVAQGDVIGLAKLERDLGIRKRKPEVVKPAVTTDAPPSPEVKVFFCNDKYPDCSRFFDSEKGLAFHWKSHEGRVGSSRRKAKAAEAVEE